MNKKRFWKIFAVVFVIAFVANVLVAYLWGRAFPDSSWSWDTTTTTAALLALMVAYVRRHDGIKQERQKEGEKPRWPASPKLQRGEQWGPSQDRK